MKHTYKYLIAVSIVTGTSLTAMLSSQETQEQTILERRRVPFRLDALQVEALPQTNPAALRAYNADHADKKVSTFNPNLLWHYAKTNDIENMKILIEKAIQSGQSINVNEPIKGGYTPLLLAIENNNPAMVDFLISKRAYAAASYYDEEFKKALLYNTPLHYAMRTGNAAIVKLLVDKGAYDWSAQNLIGETPNAILATQSPDFKAAVEKIKADKTAELQQYSCWGRCD